jgi:predicted metal-dependent enzyme (double-stranded beta helix superfamily)
MESIAQRAAVEAWPWPDSLDALTAAPKHHTVLLENDRVRVVHTHIPPGDLVPVHTHRWPGVVYVQSWSDFIRRDQHGNVLLDSRSINPRPKAPAVQWLEPLPPHSVENIGDAEISLLIVELKGTPSKVG